MITQSKTEISAPPQTTRHCRSIRSRFAVSSLSRTSAGLRRVTVRQITRPNRSLVGVLLLAASTFFLAQLDAEGQTADPSKEAWTAVDVSFELSQRTRLTAIAEKHNREDVPHGQGKIGAVFSYRMKRLGKHFRGDPDQENDYNLVLGAGYEFVQTSQNGSTKREHRVLLQATPKYFLFAKVLVQDRNRVEFRWSGTYNFRYRNKLTIDRPFKIKKVRLSPYVSGELFWDRNKHSWNQNQYGFGVRWPYRKFFILDLYYLHQNCTTCSPSSLNVAGVTANFYFDWPGKK